MVLNIDTSTKRDRITSLINWKSSARLERAEQLLRYGLVNKELYNMVIRAYNIADSIYPGECDILLNTQTLYDSTKKIYKVYYEPYLVIHFPELLLRNSKRQSILMKDLFFKVTFSKIGDFTTITGFYGERTTVSYAEYSSNFRFSHMETGDFTSPPLWLGFCFGDGDIPMVRQRYNQTKDGDPVKDNIITMLFLNIKDYLSWESLEGGPHKKMGDIGNRVNLYDPNELTMHDVIVYCDDVLRHKEQIKCDIVYRNNYYRISDNEKFEQSLVAIMTRYGSNSLLFKKSEDGQLFKHNSSPRAAILSTVPILFREKPYFYNIYDTITKITDENLYLNPKFKEYVRTKLECAINNEAFRSNFIERLQNQTQID